MPLSVSFKTFFNEDIKPQLQLEHWVSHTWQQIFLTQDLSAFLFF